MNTHIVRIVISVIAAAHAAAALSFSDEISNHTELSSMSSYVSGDPTLLSMFNDATDATILAPENSAFRQLVGAGNISASDLANSSLIESILRYQIVNGTWQVDDFTSTPLFLHTHLNNPGFANVTGGQAVQFVNANGSTNYVSGLNAVGRLVNNSFDYDNGVVHVVNQALLIPQSTTDTLLAANLTAALGLTTRSDSPNKFNDTRNMTFFAPRNAGFERVGSILQSNSTQDVDLARVADYHMVPERVLYSTRMRNETLTTEAGNNMTLRVIDGTAYVNSARVLSTDLLLNNGVMHVLSDVLNPDNTTVEPDPGASEQPIAFGDASSGPIDPLTSGQPTPTSVIPLLPLYSISGESATTTSGTATSDTATSSPTETGGGGGDGGSDGGGGGGAGGGEGGAVTPRETRHGGVAVAAAAAAVGIGALLFAA